jgi:hypothetical protein
VGGGLLIGLTERKKNLSPGMTGGQLLQFGSNY